MEKEKFINAFFWYLYGFILKSWSLIHLEFILVCTMSYEPNFNLFPSGYPLMPAPIIKSLSSLVIRDTIFNMF